MILKLTTNHDTLVVTFLLILFKCKFEDVLAEPEGTHSIDCVWKLSYICFNLWKNICYKISTLLMGICIAGELGCEFAHASFLHIWCFTPCIKYMELNCGFLKKFWSQCVQCVCEPCCKTCGLIFSAFKRVWVVCWTQRRLKNIITPGQAVQGPWQLKNENRINCKKIIQPHRLGVLFLHNVKYFCDYLRWFHNLICSNKLSIIYIKWSCLCFQMNKILSTDSWIVWGFLMCSIIRPQINTTHLKK